MLWAGLHAALLQASLSLHKRQSCEYFSLQFAGLGANKSPCNLRPVAVCSYSAKRCMLKSARYATVGPGGEFAKYRYVRR